MKCEGIEGERIEMQAIHAGPKRVGTVLLKVL